MMSKRSSISMQRSTNQHQDDGQVKERYIYRLPSAVTSPLAWVEMTALSSYMSDTYLEGAMNNLCHALMSQPKLPYNPYPGFIQRLRYLMHVFQMSDPMSNSIGQCLKTNRPCMYGLPDCSNVWGIKEMVNVMDGKGLKRYEWLIQNVTPKGISGIKQHTGYMGNILASIVGPAAFTGSMYADVASVDIRLEYVLYGPDVSVGVDLFVQSIIDDIEMCSSNTSPHYLLGVNTPHVEADKLQTNKQKSKFSSTKLATAPSKSTTTLTAKVSHNSLLSTKSIHATTSSTKQNSSQIIPPCDVWSKDDIITRKDEFITAIHTAVKHKQMVSLEFVFALNEEATAYRHGSKQYVLHFIETNEETDEEWLHSFSEFPYLTVHEGVFLSKSDCEVYMQTMLRHPRIAKELDNAEEDADMYRYQQIDSQEARIEEKVAYLGVVVAPIKRRIQQLLSKLDPTMDIFQAVHLALSMVLLDRTKWKNEVLVELHQYLHSTAQQWHLAMSYNVTMQKVLLSALHKQVDETQQEDSIVQTLMLQYQKSLLHALDSSLHDRPSDQCTIQTMVQIKLSSLAANLREDVVDKQQVVQKLISLQLYCTTVFLQLLEDVSSLLRQINIQSLIKESLSVTSLDMKNDSTDIKKKKSKTQLGQLPAQRLPSSAVIHHGVEVHKITQQRHQYLVVEEARKNSSCPRVMATEAVLLQYLIDVKLDQVWRDYLLDLLSKPWLSPNPYPSLVTHLKCAAFRMQLCYEHNDQLIKRILHFESIKVVDKTHCVCNIPGSNAYGCASALGALDTSTTGFARIANIAKGVARKLPFTRKGQYQISHSLAISNLCPLYGEFVPYLNELVLEESYYIRGPLGAHNEAIALFAKIVYDQVVEVFDQNQLVILGVVFETSGLLPTQQILGDRDDFIKQFVSAVNQKQHVYIKFYQGIGWRYLGIKKFLQFHYLYVDKADDRYEAYYPVSWIHHHQNVFLSQKEASIHFQYVKLPSETRIVSEIDSAIQHAMKEGLMIPLYKLLLTRILIKKDSLCLAELWRVYHSVAFQLDYVTSLNQGLQDLIGTAIHNQHLVAPMGNSRKGKDKRTNKVHPLKKETMRDFYQAFSSKTIEILQDPCTFAPKSLIQLVKTKLAEISEVDAVYVPGSLLKLEAIGVLQDIADMLQPIQDIIATDLLQICPHTQTLLSEIMASSENG